MANCGKLKPKMVIEKEIKGGRPNTDLFLQSIE